MGEHGDIVGTAPALPCARKSRRQVGDAQAQPVAKFLLEVRRRPFDQPRTLPTADGQRISLRQESLDRVVAYLTQVEPLQQMRRRTCEGRRRAIGGQGSPAGAVAKRPPRVSFSTASASADIEWINRPAAAGAENCAPLRHVRQARRFLGFAVRSAWLSPESHLLSFRFSRIWKVGDRRNRWGVLSVGLARRPLGDAGWEDA